MTGTLFIGFIAVTAGAVVALLARYLGRRVAIGASAGLAVWFTYVSLLALFGVTRNTSMRPPGFAFVLIPVVTFLLLFIWRALARPRVALAFPLWILLGLQCFRIGVELFLHQLWRNGLVSRMLTFEGANVDIFVGATAPFIAWLTTQRPSRLTLAFVWNAMGLLALANVVVRAVLTAPGPLNLIHTEPPNLMFATFPFLFIPAFFVPLAVVLHVAAMQAISRLMSGRAAPVPATRIHSLADQAQR